LGSIPKANTLFLISDSCIFTKIYPGIISIHSNSSTASLASSQVIAFIIGCTFGNTIFFPSAIAIVIVSSQATSLSYRKLNISSVLIDSSLMFSKTSICFLSGSQNFLYFFFSSACSAKVIIESTPPLVVSLV
jgi:hypothetical protein